MDELVHYPTKKLKKCGFGRSGRLSMSAPLRVERSETKLKSSFLRDVNAMLTGFGKDEKTARANYWEGQSGKNSQCKAHHFLA